jgi:hypothetical protein
VGISPQLAADALTPNHVIDAAWFFGVGLLNLAVLLRAMRGQGLADVLMLRPPPAAVTAVAVAPLAAAAAATTNITAATTTTATTALPLSGLVVDALYCLRQIAAVPGWMLPALALWRPSARASLFRALLRLLGLGGHARAFATVAAAAANATTTSSPLDPALAAAPLAGFWTTLLLVANADAFARYAGLLPRGALFIAQRRLALRRLERRLERPLPGGASFYSLSCGGASAMVAAAAEGEIGWGRRLVRVASHAALRVLWLLDMAWRLVETAWMLVTRSLLLGMLLLSFFVGDELSDDFVTGLRRRLARPSGAVQQLLWMAMMTALLPVRVAVAYAWGFADGAFDLSSRPSMARLRGLVRRVIDWDGTVRARRPAAAMATATAAATVVASSAPAALRRRRVPAATLAAGAAAAGDAPAAPAAPTATQPQQQQQQQQQAPPPPPPPPPAPGPAPAPAPAPAFPQTTTQQQQQQQQLADRLASSVLAAIERQQQQQQQQRPLVARLPAPSAPGALPNNGNNNASNNEPQMTMLASMPSPGEMLGSSLRGLVEARPAAGDAPLVLVGISAYTTTTNRRPPAATAPPAAAAAAPRPAAWTLGGAASSSPPSSASASPSASSAGVPPPPPAAAVDDEEEDAEEVACRMLDAVASSLATMGGAAAGSAGGGGGATAGSASSAAPAPAQPGSNVTVLRWRRQTPADRAADRAWARQADRRLLCAHALLEQLLELHRALLPVPIWLRFLSRGGLFGLGAPPPPAAPAPSSSLTFLAAVAGIAYLAIAARTVWRRGAALAWAVRLAARRGALYGRYVTRPAALSRSASGRRGSGDAEEAEEGACCPICTEPLFPREEDGWEEGSALPPLAVELPCCRQVFCEPCLREWLARAGSCPTCRAALKPPAAAVGGGAGGARDGAVPVLPNLF